MPRSPVRSGSGRRAISPPSRCSADEPMCSTGLNDKSALRASKSEMDLLKKELTKVTERWSDIPSMRQELSDLHESLVVICNNGNVRLGVFAWDEMKEPSKFTDLIKTAQWRPLEEFSELLIEASLWYYLRVPNQIRAISMRSLKTLEKIKPPPVITSDLSSCRQVQRARENLLAWMIEPTRHLVEIRKDMSHPISLIESATMTWTEEEESVATAREWHVWDELTEQEKIKELQAQVKKLHDRASTNEAFSSERYEAGMVGMRARLRRNAAKDIRPLFVKLSNVYQRLQELLSDETANPPP